jgi:hypothetical protein
MSRCIRKAFTYCDGNIAAQAQVQVQAERATLGDCAT